MESLKQKGSLQISRDVIGSIAGVCAQEVDGVAGLTRRVPGIANGILRGASKTPVGVSLRDDSVEISIGVALGYGAKIDKTCTAIQNHVKQNVQTMTGMAVSKVNVQVSQIVFPAEKAGQA